MAEKSTINALPKLPGFNFSHLNQPITFGKIQSFGMVQGVPIVKKVDDSPLKAKKAVGATEVMFSDDAIYRLHPQWKTLSNKVLRFFGYFMESVPESQVERERVRKVSVLFHLADRTVTVNETPAVGNHGMRAGCIMARHLDAAVNTGTLKVGSDLKMRSRDVYLVDCDAFTREFYQTMGLPMGGAQEYPEDNFEKTQMPVKRGIDPDHILLKRSMEDQAAAASGHHSSTLTPADRRKALMYFKHGQEALTFNAAHEKRLFRVLFFLADETMAITQIHSANDGRDQHAAFVRRGNIPRGNFSMNSIDTCTPIRGKDPVTFNAKDLRTGQAITLFAREFYVYSCDPFTKKYYKTMFDIDQEDYEKPWTEGDAPEIPRKVMEPPPYNGFGTEEDSLGSFKNIVLKPPKKDYAKYIRQANDVLRFHAKLGVSSPENEGREFIACFYLADDTICVYEIPVRNSGHVGGKVFARAKDPNVTQEQMRSGAVLKLAGQVYELLEMDERTKKYLETGISMGNEENTEAEELLARVRKVLTQRFSRVTEAYRHFNTSKNGLGMSDLKKLFRECEVKVETDDTMAEIMRRVDRDQDGVVSLQEFVENLLRVSLHNPPPMSDEPLSTKSYAEAQAVKTKKEFAEKVLRMFIAKLEARRTFIVDTFRIVSDRALDNMIGVDTFKATVQDKLGLALSKEELDALVYKFFQVDGMADWENRRLTLREFRKVLDQ